MCRPDRCPAIPTGHSAVPTSDSRRPPVGRTRRSEGTRWLPVLAALPSQQLVCSTRPPISHFRRPRTAERQSRQSIRTARASPVFPPWCSVESPTLHSSLRPVCATHRPSASSVSSGRPSYLRLSVASRRCQRIDLRPEDNGFSSLKTCNERTARPASTRGQRREEAAPHHLFEGNPP